MLDTTYYYETIQLLQQSVQGKNWIEPTTFSCNSVLWKLSKTSSYWIKMKCAEMKFDSIKIF